jgi:hypothetical protein
MLRARGRCCLTEVTDGGQESWLTEVVVTSGLEVEGLFCSLKGLLLPPALQRGWWLERPMTEESGGFLLDCGNTAMEV